MSSDINIPSLLGEKLALDPTLHGAVSATLKEFSPWIASSGMPFFPAYTDHSAKHISEVLATACALVTIESVSLLTPRIQRRWFCLLSCMIARCILRTIAFAL